MKGFTGEWAKLQKGEVKYKWGDRIPLSTVVCNSKNKKYLKACIPYHSG